MKVELPAPALTDGLTAYLTRHPTSLTTKINKGYFTPQLPKSKSAKKTHNPLYFSIWFSWDSIFEGDPQESLAAASPASEIPGSSNPPRASKGKLPGLSMAEGCSLCIFFPCLFWKKQVETANRPSHDQPLDDLGYILKEPSQQRPKKNRGGK